VQAARWTHKRRDASGNLLAVWMRSRENVCQTTRPIEEAQWWRLDKGRMRASELQKIPTRRGQSLRNIIIHVQSRLTQLHLQSNYLQLAAQELQGAKRQRVVQ